MNDLATTQRRLWRLLAAPSGVRAALAEAGDPEGGGKDGTGAADSPHDPKSEAPAESGDSVVDADTGVAAPSSPDPAPEPAADLPSDPPAEIDAARAAWTIGPKTAHVDDPLLACLVTRHLLLGEHAALADLDSQRGEMIVGDDRDEGDDAGGSREGVHPRNEQIKGGHSRKGRSGSIAGLQYAR